MFYYINSLIHVLLKKITVIIMHNKDIHSGSDKQDWGQALSFYYLMLSYWPDQMLSNGVEPA